MANLAATHSARATPKNGLLVWGGLCLLLTLGCGTALVALAHLGANESRRANAAGQRAVIDPLTGRVVLGTSSGPAERFDVGAEPKPAPAADNHADTAADPESPEIAPSEEGDPAATTPPASSDTPDSLRTEPLSETIPDTPVAPGDSLVPAPAPEISEKRDGLVLPNRGADNALPRQFYARHFVRTPDQHLLSVVILDAGLSAQSLPLVFALPKEITVAVSPYTIDAAGRIAVLRHAGYETWGMLPAMGARYPQDDPGPLGLVISLPKEELARRLRIVLSDTIGSVGVVLPPTEILSTKEAVLDTVTSELESRGLYLFAANTGSKVAVKAPPTLHADLILDANADSDAIASTLGQIDAKLKANEHVVLVTSARPQSLLALQAWFKQHPLAGPAVLAPLSAHYLPKDAPAPPAPAEGEKKPEKKDEKKPEQKKPEKKDEKKKSESH